MRKIIGFVIGACLCFLFFSGNAAADYSNSLNDGKGDVWHWYVTETTWGWSYNNERPNIDITEISTSGSEGNVTVTIKVKGTITDSEKIYYQFDLVDNKGTSSTDDDISSYILYTNQTCTIYKTRETTNTSDIGADLSDNTSHSGGTLTIHFQLTDIGAPGHLTSATKISGCAYDYAETGDTTGEYYYDMVPDVPTGGGGTTGGNETGAGKKEGGKGFIPGFETAVLIGAIGISAVLISKKLR